MQRVVDYDVVQMQRDMAGKGWESSDLARATGLNKATISRFFAGSFRTAPTAKRIAKALGRALKHYVVDLHVGPGHQSSEANA